MLNGGFSPPDFGGRNDCDFNANLSQVLGQPTTTWIRDAGAWRLETVGEKNTREAAEAAATLTATRAIGINVIDAPEGIDRRAIADMVISELNNIRQWIAAFKVEVAAATNLADLKTRVAGLPNMPDRTLAQARTAYKNSINAGAVDS